jgi:hypothetical protein
VDLSECAGGAARKRIYPCFASRRRSVSNCKLPVAHALQIETWAETWVGTSYSELLKNGEIVSATHGEQLRPPG